MRPDRRVRGWTDFFSADRHSYDHHALIACPYPTNTINSKRRVIWVLLSLAPRLCLFLSAMSFLHKSQSQQKPHSSTSIDTTNLKSSFSSSAKHQDECESDDDSVPASPVSVASDSSAGSWGKMSQLSRGPPAIRRHPEYYIDSGDVVFLVRVKISLCRSMGIFVADMTLWIG